MLRNKRANFLAVFLAVTLLAGCGARAIHPGAANKFDSSAYDALLVTDSVIQSTKTDLANNVFPANVAASVKTALNGLIDAYNVTNVSYRAYHSAALAGNATPAQQQSVQSGLDSMAAATTNLTNAKVPK